MKMEANNIVSYIHIHFLNWIILEIQFIESFQRLFS